ncbi:MAG: hypothetical protein KAT37_00640 [Candidatus Aenigmarchaeota archaeon]|nr:hypothetical protein [Candidatus Aenigmarchaeota archaeon]
MLFKKLFSKKEEKPLEIELKLEEIEEWVRKENRKFMEDLEGDIGENYVILEEKLEKLREFLKLFRQAEIHPDVIERLKKAAQTNKLMIESSMENFIESFSIPKEKDFKSAQNFCRDVSVKIAELGKKNRRGFLIVTEALKDTKDLTKSIGELEGKTLELWKTLKEKGKRINDIEETINLGKSVISDIERKPEIEKNIQSLESGLDFQRQKMEKAKKEAEEFKDSKEMSKLKKMEKSLEDLKTKRSRMEDRIIQEMSNFEKAFKKIGYSEIEKSKAINRYMENPVDAIVEPKGLDKFRELAFFVKDGIKKNRFELSDKAKDKALLGIERVESGVLDWALKEHKEITAKISESERKIRKNKIIEEKKEKEKEYEDWNQTITKTKKRIKDLKEEREEIGKKIESQRKMLGKKLKSLSEKEVKIT